MAGSSRAVRLGSPAGAAGVPPAPGNGGVTPAPGFLTGGPSEAAGVGDLPSGAAVGPASAVALSGGASSVSQMAMRTFGGTTRALPEYVRPLSLTLAMSR